MITTCTECQARYQLDSEKIPPRVIKVRCPSCKGVFSLDGSQARKEAERAPEPSVAVQDEYQEHTGSPAVEKPVVAVPKPVVVAEKPVVEKPVVEAPAAREPVAREPVAEKPVMDEPVAHVPPTSAAPALSPAAVPASEPATEVAVMDPPAERSTRRRRSKEEMLARALVSDIMVYNRDLYDRSKAEGNLLEALGAEIKKSWELYKEKVTPEVANSTNHFRDALNEILADGENLF